MNRRRFIRTGALWTAAAPYILRGQGLSLRDLVMVGKHPISSVEYSANATTFDGSTNYVRRSSTLTGASNGKLITFSCWISLTGSSGSQYQIFEGVAGTIGLYISAANRLDFFLKTSSYAECVTMESGVLSLSGTGWHHILISADSGSVGSCYMYLDGSTTSPYRNATNATIDFERNSHTIGAAYNSIYKFAGCISELWIDETQCMDITSSTVRAQFRTSGGKPAGDLTSVGSPIIYMKNPYNSFGTNSGTGGDFNVTGLLNACTGP